MRTRSCEVGASRWRKVARVLTLAGLLLSFIQGPVGLQDARAATLTVTTTADAAVSDGNCSLREAIQAATTNSAVDACPAGDAVSSDTINFAVSGTVTLTAQLEVSTTDPLVIDGDGMVTINGGGHRILNVAAGGDVELVEIALAGGWADAGAGISNAGTLTLTDSSLTSSMTIGTYACGAGILNTGTLTIIRSTVSSNYSTYHTGGGICNFGELTIEESTLSGNTASHDGGAIHNSGTATITDSTFSGNTANYYGGGIYNHTGTLVLTNTTVNANHALYGAGLFNHANGTATITNSTLSGNVAGYDGGGIYNQGHMGIYNATITGNGAQFGGGIKGTGLWLALRNTLLAGNSASVDGPDCYAMTAASGGYNLIGNTAGCGISVGTGDLRNVEPDLGPLQDNGGPTDTHALMLDSLAVDAGNPVGCLNDVGEELVTDQRGFARPVDGDGDMQAVCDIGAYELAPTTASFSVFLPCILRNYCAPLYLDDFGSSGSGWPIQDTGDVAYEYLSGEYRILLRSTNWWAAAAPGFAAADFVIEADVRNAGAAYGTYGLLFGLSGDWGEFYEFEIGSEGYFAVYKYDHSVWTELASGSSGAVNTGAASNRLKVLREGATIKAYANGTLLAILTDGSFTGSRRLGVIAFSYDDPNVDVRNDNFTVYPLSCAGLGGLPPSGVFPAGATTDRETWKEGSASDR